MFPEAPVPEPSNAVERMLPGGGTERMLPGGGIERIFPGRIASHLSEASKTPLDTSGSQIIDYLKRAKPGLHDRGIASVMATAAAWSYADTSTYAEVMSRRGFAGGKALSINLRNDALLVGTTACILQSGQTREGRRGDVVILSFRGTEPLSIINWLGDINAKTEPFHSLGRVHGGFYRPLLALWNVLTKLLDQAMNRGDLCKAGESAMRRYTCGEPWSEDADDVPATSEQGGPALYITGHSLGGALAVLAAARIFADSSLSNKYWKALRGIYTFGQPMVGDDDFAKRFGEPFKGLLYRHIYKNDIVPHFPPYSAGEFSHIGEVYCSTEYGWEYQRAPTGQARSFLGSTVTGTLAFVMDQIAGIPLVGKIHMPYSWSAHSPVNYLRSSQFAHPSAALL